MPELPEVQTVLDTLHAQMGHARIRDVQVRWARIIHGDPQTFASLVCGRRIEDYARIGKYLCFDLGDVWWIAHLRMEGKFYLQQPSAPVDARHVHVIFSWKTAGSCAITIPASSDACTLIPSRAACGNALALPVSERMRWMRR